jgi:hypothetical protein
VRGASEGLAQTGMNLADLDDLLEGGADKVCKALPRVFAKWAQTWIFLYGGQDVSVR